MTVGERKLLEKVQAETADCKQMLSDLLAHMNVQQKGRRSNLVFRERAHYEVSKLKQVKEA